MDEPAQDLPAHAPGDVEKFWELAKVHAGLNPVPSYFGPTALESITPPAFSLGDTAEEADEALRALVEAGGSDLRTPLGAFATHADLPVEGLLGIVLDGEGHPRALVETIGVVVDDDVVTERLRVVYDA